jgi:hypothetical protein
MKTKFQYNIKRSLFRVLPMALLMGAPTLNSCEKDPMPTRTVVIDWDWNHLPSVDDVRKYVKQSDVKTVNLHILDYPSDGFTTDAFHRARDSLENRYFSVSSKVCGSGTIFINGDNGAHLTEINDDLMGMAYVDSLWYTSKGFNIRRKTDIFKSK